MHDVRTLLGSLFASEPLINCRLDYLFIYLDMYMGVNKASIAALVGRSTTKR